MTGWIPTGTYRLSKPEWRTLKLEISQICLFKNAIHLCPEMLYFHLKMRLAARVRADPLGEFTLDPLAGMYLKGMGRHPRTLEEVEGNGKEERG